jgi:hypothetical protein
MLQRDPGNRDAERARVVEVGQAQSAGLVLLPEGHVLFWAGQRPHTPFQSAPDAGADVRGVAPPDLFEDRNGAQTWGRFQHRKDLAILNIAETVGPAPATRRLLPHPRLDCRRVPTCVSLGPSIPVLLFSAALTPAIIARAVQIGINSVVEKPAPGNELVRFVVSHMRRAA